MRETSSLDKPRIAVLGLGHVGLPTALGFAELGWDVIGVDDDVSKVAMIRSGQAPFYEPGLNDLLARGLAGGRLSFSHKRRSRACAKPRFCSFALGPPPEGHWGG